MNSRFVPCNRKTVNMSKSLIQEKSFSFAVRMVLHCRTRLSGKDDVVLSRQLLRSGTSIGANVEEALGGQSRKDFIAKLGIAAREAREAHYWLRVTRKVNSDRDPETLSLQKECEELLKILNSIILTSRRTLHTNPKLTIPDPELIDNSTVRAQIRKCCPNPDTNSERRTHNSELPR